jgi:hypothetical protein
MQIKKTQLAKIIREEIAKAVNEAEYKPRGFEERRKNALYYAYADTQMGVDPEKVAALFDMALDKAIEAGGVSSETEESRDVFIGIEDEIRKAKGVGEGNIAKVLMALNTLKGMSVDQLKAIPRSAEVAAAAMKRAQPEIKRKRAVQAKRPIGDIMGKLDEEEIQAARFDHAHLPGNPKEGQFGKVQPLEEVGILSTMLDPAMVAGLSDAARVAIAMLDPILTMGLPSAAVAGLMNMLMKNEDIPKEEREMIAAALEGDKPAGIPADELGAKR